MQHDEVIWQVINQNFCSYKVKMLTQNFCKNEQNVTGLCNRSSCPLANSKYASVQEDKGVCYLWIKTIERAHSPKNMWEKIKLSRNYAKALEQIDKQLEYWPKFMIHKNKQRLTKIHQYLIRMRKLKLKVTPTIVGINKKIDRREKRREAKALKASRITNTITNELIERLKTGMYGDEILNFPAKEYEKAVDTVGEADEIEDESDEEEESEEEHEFVEAYDEESEEEDMENLGSKFMGDDEGDEDDSEEDEDDDEDDEDDDDDDEDDEQGGEDDEDEDGDDGEDGEDEGDSKPKAPPKVQKKRKKPVSKKKAAPKRGRVELEYEMEEEEEEREQVFNR